jgi:acyl-coenzyme A thioesterase PaaI-like protein
MAPELLNDELLRENACFGCGLTNPDGLKIRVYRDAANAARLLGEFEPSPRMAGFPGITHGGAIFTALDCMASWAGMILRAGPKAIWVLRSASVKYRQPAFQEAPLKLSAEIEEQGADWDAIVVRTEACDSQGRRLVEGRFNVVPLPPDRFLKIAGIREMPENWSVWIDRVDQ